MSEEVFGTGSPTSPSGAGGQTPPLKDRTSDAVQQAQRGAGDVAQVAADKTKDVVAETQRQGRNLLSEAGEEAGRQAAQQQRQLVGNLRSFADELEAMTTRSEQQGLAAEVASKARDRVRSFADWLDARQPGDVLEEVRGFGRDRPGAFLAGAAVAGVLVGRLTRGVTAAHADDADRSRSVPDTDRLGPPPQVVPGSSGDPIGYGAPAVEAQLRGETERAGGYAGEPETYPEYPVGTDRPHGGSVSRPYPAEGAVPRSPMDPEAAP